ncbi:2Fe-2S iron-sulfur cluster-binding protein [Streptomyces sp. NPDC096176]|uniref:2Fe-2S iron-sulfur cluster-binding protein n=1 Tax=Streptomyces sp. NPDC096176 TaxID=3366079 RepID=UPI0037FB46A0
MSNEDNPQGFPRELRDLPDGYEPERGGEHYDQYGSYGSYGRHETHDAHEAHEAHEAYEAHEAHEAYGSQGDHGGWQPTPQGGEYDGEATAFFQLPPEFTADAAPLEAPGHGYVPPMITPLTPAVNADPAATGNWAPQWPEPAQEAHEPADQNGTGQWSFHGAESSASPQPGFAPGYDLRPDAASAPAGGAESDADLDSDSGEFPLPSGAAAPWVGMTSGGTTPPATLPGGAPAPWATLPGGAPAQWAEQAQQEQAQVEREQAEAQVEREQAEEPAAAAAPDPAAAAEPEPQDAGTVPTDPAASVTDAGAAASAAADTTTETAPEEPAPPVLPDAVDSLPNGNEEHPPTSYVLRVNGTDRPVSDAWIGESLLYVLRERLGLAGAKDGCSQGECGACNVQVDGRLVASCLVPAATAAGSEVRTVEGLATDGEPSDVQRALAACGAVQCGFCIPGMAMTVHDLLEGNHAPTELETRQALCGNLCRCSGYRGVLDAVREVVAERAASAAAAMDPADAEAATDAGTEPRIPHQAPPGAGSVQVHPHDGGMA